MQAIPSHIYIYLCRFTTACYVDSQQFKIIHKCQCIEVIKEQTKVKVIRHRRGVIVIKLKVPKASQPPVQ